MFSRKGAKFAKGEEKQIHLCGLGVPSTESTLSLVEWAQDRHWREK
jgi:hypothetical protein